MTDIDHKRLAKELDRRRRRRRTVTLGAVLAAAIAAATYLRCGKGWGTGGKGPGEGGTTVTTPSDALARCSIRLTATGITVDGKSMTRDEAITACKSRTGADVLITGDARQGDWDELKGSLEAASIPFFTREPRGVTPPDAGAPVPSD